MLLLWYRFLFFSWLFKDANKGNQFEQHAAWQYNKQQAHWLFAYARRWLFLSVLFYLLGLLTEAVLQFPGISAIFYVPSVLGITVNSVIGVLIAWLKWMP